MFCFESFCICLSSDSRNLWFIVHYQGKSQSKMRTTFMGYKYNTINFSHEFITKCTNPLVTYWLTLQRKECVSVNIYLLLRLFWLSCLYVTYTNRIINTLLSLFSIFSVDNKNSLFIRYISSCSKSLHCVYDSQNLLKKGQYLLTIQLNACII